MNQELWKLFTGQRLEASAKAAGITLWKKSVERYEVNRFGRRPVYNGLLLSPDDHDKLKKYFEQKTAKKESNESNPDIQKKIGTRKKNEHQQIAKYVREHWNLDDQEIERFAEFSNQTGSQRVIRKKKMDFELKVTMALVAWARHQQTDYEMLLRKQNDELFRKHRSEAELCHKERAERKIDFNLHVTIQKALKDNFEETRQEAYLALKKVKTKEAEIWLEQRKNDRSIACAV